MKWQGDESLPFHVGLGFQNIGSSNGEHGTVRNVIQISKGDFLGYTKVLANCQFARELKTYIASEIFLLAQNAIIDVQLGVKYSELARVVSFI